MSLLTDIVDDFIDGKIGDGRVVTKREVFERYGRRYSKTTLGLILPSSRFTKMVRWGVYEFNPNIIERRKKKRISS